MEAARLNIDTFAIVCEFLTDVSDVLSCILTCSALRPVATQCLLSVHPVRLRGDTSIPRFHRFLFADASAHAPHVCMLDIDFPPHPEQVALLLEILATCSQIKCISVFSADCAHNSHGSSSNTNLFGVVTSDLHSYMSNMHVFREIAAIKTLQSLFLHLTPPNLYGTAILKKILSHLDVPLRTFRTGQLLGQWNPDTLEHLSCLAPTLEELELGYLVLGAAPSPSLITPPWPPVSTLTPYPFVRSLTVSMFNRLPQVEHLQHLFPALDGVLSFGRPKFVRELHGDVAEIRTTNQRAQELSETGGVSGSSARVWRKLGRVECDAFTFYALGLRCPIGLAVIGDIASHTLHYAAEALRGNPVPKLKLELELEPDSDLAMFAPLFAREFAENVTHLTLVLNHRCVHIGGHGGSFRVPGREVQWDGIRAQWGGLLRKMPQLLQHLRKLTHLYIMIHANVYHFRPLLSDSVAPFNPEDAMECEGTAITLIPQFPSLRYLFFSTSGNRAKGEELDGTKHRWEILEQWHTRRSYRIAEPGMDVYGTVPDVGEGRPLVELHSEDVVETILRKEQLGLASKVDQENRVFAQTIAPRQS